MREKELQATSGMRLYSGANKRLYLNAHERAAFIDAAHLAPLHIRAFCLTLVYTGCRLSEARELSIHSLQADEGILSIRSLKKRNKHHIRELHIPNEVVALLTEQYGACDGRTYLWPVGSTNVSRISAYRWVKLVMQQAEIIGPQASPKGLRHSFGVRAISAGVPLSTVQKWLGHASIETTAIYTNAVGNEERRLSSLMWD